MVKITEILGHRRIKTKSEGAELPLSNILQTSSQDLFSMNHLEA